MRTSDTQTARVLRPLAAAVVMICAVWCFAAALAVDTPKLQATASEYQVTAAADVGGSYQAVNRAQGLRASFSNGGVRILPQIGDSPWAVGLQLTSYGPMDGTWTVTAGPARAQGAQVDQSFGDAIFGWYANAEDGLIQGFMIPGPAGAATVEGQYRHEIDIALTTEGVEARTVDDGSVVFVTPGAREVLRYTLIDGVDGAGAAIPVKVGLAKNADGGIFLQLIPVVTAQIARYPVKVRMRLDTQELKNEAEGGTTSDLLFAPPEDTCAGAQVIPAGPYPVLSTTVDNTTATNTGDPAPTCQSTWNHGLWYTFTPTDNNTFTVTTCANQAPGTTRSDTILAVFTSTAGCAGPFTQVACNDDYSGCTGHTLQSTLTFAGTAGTTYYILAYSYSTTYGAFQIQVTEPLPPPPEDTCAGAQLIPGSGLAWPYLTTPVDNTWATSTNDPGASCSTTEALGLWYTFTPDVGGQYYITTCRNLAPGNVREDTVLDIFTSAAGCAGPFTELGASYCNDNNTDCTGHTLQSLIQPVLTAGTTYYILAYNTGTTSPGNIQLYVAPSPPPPANDDCTGAEVIPGAGPWPYLTTSVDITNATTTGGDPTSWSCNTSVSHVAWYEITPAATGAYTFTTCKNAAPGTTCLDTVLAVYTSSTNACGGTYTSVACNDTDSTCTGATGDATVSAALLAGQKYYVLVGSPGTTVPQPGGVQLQVSYIPPPSNDNCSAPAPLTLDIPLYGWTMGAFNDYQLSSTAPTCFTLPAGPPAPIGQTASTAPGRDVVYSFTPAIDGYYSVRAYSYSTAQNLVVYVSSDCPAATPGTPVTINNPPCVGASNRGSASWQEEVMCVPMTAGQTYYAFVDDNTAANAGSAFYIKVRPCQMEVEPNDTPAQANLFTCGIEGQFDVATNVDFYQLPGATAGSRVFVMVDTGASAYTDTTVRVTNTTDTLEYDDDDNDTPFGGTGSNVEGVTLSGNPPFYIRVADYSTTSLIQPYRVYASVTPPIAAAVHETEPNDTPAQANSSALNYFYGTSSATTDQDWYSFTAAAGDQVFIGLDGDPNYDGSANAHALALYDASGNLLVRVNNGSSTATLNRPPTLNNLAATAPTSAGEALEWNAAYDGTYFVLVTATSGSGQEYALSININCETQAADVTITKQDAPDPIPTGGDLTYTLQVTNNGPGAAGVSVSDPLPAGTTFVSVTTPSGWTSSHPPVGSGGTVICSGPLNSGDSTTITIVVKVDWCLGDGHQIVNNATVTSSGPDPDPSNNTASTTTTVIDNGVCSDNNACTLGDVCQGTVCVPGSPKDCSDGDACTDDHCDTVTGDCSHTPKVCDDLNPCTDNLCDTQGGCYYPPNNTLPCSDGSLCTQVDVCLNGQCVGTQPVDCNDFNSCTADTCDPATGQCRHVSSPGAPCDDGDWCTVGDTCTCTGGTGLLENFDTVTPPALPAGWVSQIIVGQTGDLDWQTVTTAADTPPNSAWGQDQSHVTDKVLVSPAFTGAVGAQLTFQQRRGFEGTSFCFDGGVLEIKIATNDWQDIIDAGGVWVSGGYNGTVYATDENPLANRPAWCYSATTFETVAVTLPPSASGQLVQLRWRMGTDHSVSANGWWLDTIVLPACEATCVGTPRVCDPPAECHFDGKCDAIAHECVYPVKPGGSACTDGNPCTGPDSCNDNGICLAGPPVLPPEINTSVRVLGGGGGGAIVTWTDLPGPYNVYRGSRTGGWVYNHTCFDPGTSGPSPDLDVPPPGETFYYLVSRKDQCGESIVGRDWLENPEPNTSPCP